jgi:hypothetical protein
MSDGVKGWVAVSWKILYIRIRLMITALYI